MIMCSTSDDSKKREMFQEDEYAVFFLSYGGPDSLDDIEGFLLDIRGGRQTPKELIDEIKERYEYIGGKSPLLEITCDQAELTEKLLTMPEEDENGKELPVKKARVYVGMRHWTPYIKDVLSEMVNDGVKNIVTLCMTPYHSRMTVDAYLQKFLEAQEALNAHHLNVVHVKYWYNHPLFIEAFAERVHDALEKFPEEDRQDVQVIFTAHSLPASIVEQGDTYQDHLQETMRLIVQRLEMGATQTKPISERSHFCYQSAGARKVVWLGPSIEEMFKQVTDAGHKNILVVPIGFLVDHVEVLYDLDVECQEMLKELGARLERTESLNTSPTFMSALADIVKQTINGEWEAVIPGDKLKESLVA